MSFLETRQQYREALNKWEGEIARHRAKLADFERARDLLDENVSPLELDILEDAIAREKSDIQSIDICIRGLLCVLNTRLSVKPATV